VEFFSVLNPWHWWMLATLLIVGELVAPCAYFLALSIASALVGLVWILFPGMAVELQLGLFGTLSALLLAMAYWWRSQSKTRAARKNA
jgi:membrane protein implicated in regulation of membrane protease activity